MSNVAPDLPLPDEDEDGPYALVGTARARDGLADALETRLVAMVAPTREEPGVLAYHVHRDRADRSRLVFYEAWRSIDDLRRHLEQPYVQSFLSERHHYLLGDLDIIWLRMSGPYAAISA